jgi:predicted transcriptional regulator
MEHQRVGDHKTPKASTVTGQVGLVQTVEALRAQLDHLANQVHAVGAGGAVSAQTVRSILKARICRRNFFNARLFAEPAWDMLLELFALEIECQRVSISNLCRASGVPGTTALRWIDNLENEGLIIRRDDPLDQRRVWAELTPKGTDSMRRYFESVPVRLVPL